MSLQLVGLGTAVPEHFILQSDAAAIVQRLNGRTDRQRQLIEDVYLHAGVTKRHCAVLERSDGPLEERQFFFRAGAQARDLGPTTAERMHIYREAAPQLATTAAQRALASSSMNPNQITHLATASCTGFSAPGVDLQLVETLGLDANVARTHLGFMGCHAALNVLRVAQAMTSDPHAVVLGVCVELCSLHHQYGLSPEQVVANALFADGAAAVVCRADQASAAAWRMTAQASTVLPNTRGDMSWQIGDHGFEMTLSRQLPELIRQRLRPWITEWLSSRGHSLNGIASWAIHPGGPKIVSACEDALALTTSACQASRDTLAHYGNMSSATVLFVIEELQRHQAKLPCVALAFGPGITIEAALFE